MIYIVDETVYYVYGNFEASYRLIQYEITIDKYGWVVFCDKSEIIL